MPIKEAGSYKVRPNALAATDDATMYAEFVASVKEVDREDEIIFPEDFNVTEWKANPVWLWAHDKKSHPIGTGDKGDGSIALNQSPQALILGCKFSQANPQGAMTYALYKEGTLKMVSVGFLNTETKIYAGSEFNHPRPVKRVMDPELVECSCVPIGMNRSAMLLSIKSWDGYVDREALASVLDKGHLHGERLPEDMRRDLAPFADVRPRWAAKLLPNKIPNFSSQPGKQGLALASEKGNPAVASIATKAPLKAGKIPEAKPAPAVKEKEVPAPQAGMQEMPLSVGAQTFKAMMEAALGLAKGGIEMAAQSDNPEIKTAVSKYASYFAAGVKQMYGDAMKYFPDNKDVFIEPANLAAQYEMAEESEPEEEVMAANEETSEVAEVEEAADKDTEVDKEPGMKDDDKEKDEKGLTNPITRGEFANWYEKAFGELSPKEVMEQLLAPVLEELKTVKAQLLDHQEALEITERVLTRGR